MKSAYLCLILVLAIAGFSYADIIHVPGDYPTIQEGIAVAVSGDKVLVAAGTYTGTGRLLLKSGVDLVGAGATVTFLNFDSGVRADGATDLTVQGFTITDEMLCINGASLTIRNNIIEGASGANGIECGACGPMTIEYNTIRNNHNNGVRLCGDTPAIVRHNIIYSNKNGIECLDGASVSIYNNEIYKNERSGVNVLVDAGTVDMGGGSLGSPGNNKIYNNTLYAVYNYTSSTIKAENNWWGTSEPSSALFSGSVDYTPWLELTTLEKFTGDNQSGVIGTKLPAPLVVLVKDQYGNPLPDVQVDFAVTQGDGSVNPTLALTDANGKASTELTLGQTAGLNQVTVIVNGLSVTFSVTGIEPPVATTLERVSGDNQSGAVGTLLAAPLVVMVKDQYDEPMLDVQVHFGVIQGDGSVNPASPLTDVDGKASTELTLGQTAGLNQVTATVDGLSVTFNATGIEPPVATTLEKVSGDNQSGNVGSVLLNPMVVRVLDQYSNPMEGIMVNFEPSEGASVNPTQATTNENGQAQTILTLGIRPSEYNVTASVEGIDPVVFTATAIGIPPLVVDAGEDKTICHPNNGGAAQIGGCPTASGGTEPYTYSWAPTTGLDNPNIANPTAAPTTTTTYTVTVTDSSEPVQEASDSVTVTVYPELLADAGENKNISPGGSIQIGGNPTASGGTAPYTYSWIPIESLDNATITNPTASPSETTTYTVTVTDGNGCKDTDKVRVTVVEGLYAQITSPVEGAYVRGEIVITGTVLGGVNGLKSWILKRAKYGGQYKTINYGDTEVDNGELGRWDTTKTDEGKHMLRLTAIDNEDNERVHEITVNVDNTDPAPVIQLQSDGAMGDWTKDYTDLYVSGEVEAGAQLIEAYLVFEGGLPFTDDVKEHIGIDGTGRIAGTIPDGYNLSGNEITTVTLHLKCKDRAGNEGEGTSNTLHVDNDKPTVTIQNPVSDANFNIFNKDILIAGIADDAFGIAKVEINVYNGSGWISVDGTTDWQYHYYQNNEVAVVTVHARSIDNAGNASEIAGRKFHCIWDFPSVNISYPVDDSAVSGAVEITGLVVDSDIDDSDLHWRVDYGIGEHKINNIASGYGNKNGVLCNWDTRTLDTGQLYTLFLTVTSSSTMASIHRFDDYYVNSAGEFVVKRYNIRVTEPSLIYGDVSGDGKVTAADASLVMRHVVGELTLNSDQQTRGDLTNDGTLSSMDAALILQRVMGLILEFPIESMSLSR